MIPTNATAIIKMRTRNRGGRTDEPPGVAVNRVGVNPRSSAEPCWASPHARAIQEGGLSRKERGGDRTDQHDRTPGASFASASPRVPAHWSAVATMTPAWGKEVFRAGSTELAR